MTRVALWVFFLADVAGVVWCVKVLALELVRQVRLSTPASARHALPLLELPPDFVLIPAARRAQEPTARVIDLNAHQSALATRAS